MAFKSEFMKVFKEGLEPYGFRRMKGTDCLGKLINGEILLFISFKQYSPPDCGLKAFDVVAGVHTIYSPVPNGFPLQEKGVSLFSFKNSGVGNGAYPYYVYSDSTLSVMLDKALSETIQYIIPALNKITDLRSCTEHLALYSLSSLYCADRIIGESALLFMTDNHDTFEERLEYERKTALARYGNSPDSPEYVSYIHTVENMVRENLVACRDRIWASKELQDKVFSEANRRAEINKAQLRKYGFDI